MTPFIEALQRIQSLTKEWPGDDDAPRVIGTVNAIAAGALLAVVPKGAKGVNLKETTTVKTQFEVDLHLNLSDVGGTFAHDVEATATIEYEVDYYRDGDYVITGWSLVDIRFPGVPTATRAKDWLWPLFHRAVTDQSKFIDAAIRNHIEDSADFTPAANLHLISAVS